MIDQLDEQSRRDLMNYRMHKAKDLLKEVVFQKDNGYYSTAINRLYYACYHAAMALLLQNHLTPSTHAGVRLMLGLHFVRPGLMTKEEGRAFSLLFERRNMSDYDDFVSATFEEVEELLPKGEMFVSAVERLLAASI